MEDFMNSLDHTNPPVKQEIPEPMDTGENAGNPSAAGPSSAPDDANASFDVTEGTGLAELGKQVEEARRKEADTTKRLENFMRIEENCPRRRGKQKQSSTDEEEKSNKEDAPKAPLTTFGHSSRPRRSVNYASIERGDEAQAQSLVHEFGTGKRRAKRTRDDLDENYEEGMATKKKAAPTRNRRYNPAQAYHLIDMEARRPELEFAMCLPNVNEDRPDDDHRGLGRMLEASFAIRRSSGGFKKFLAWFSDPMIVTLMKTVDNRYVLEPDAEDRRMLKAIRHVYNIMPHRYRLDWEYSARMDVVESRKIFDGLTMPLSEIPVKSDEEKRPAASFAASAVRANCCSVEPVLADMRQTAEHFLAHHDTVHMFGCHFCCKLFASRYDLTKHECKDFCTWLVELTMQGKPLELETCYMFLCCTLCGLWLPVKTCHAGSKGWPYFASSLANHTCRTLAPLVIYFLQPFPDEGKNVRVTFPVISQIEHGFPLKCSECGTEDFGSLNECEEHFKAKHKQLQCEKCDKKFGTQFLWKNHIQSHNSPSAQFSQYLMYSATYHPPPGSNREPHVGFNTEIPAFGGCTGAELEALEADTKENEFVESDAEVMRKKMLKWKPAPKPDPKSSSESEYSTDSSSDSSDSEPKRKKKNRIEPTHDYNSDSSSDDVTGNRKKKPKPVPVVEPGAPGDLGYDHIDRDSLFKREPVEREAIRRLEKLTNTNLFAVQERLMGAEDVMEFLGETEEASEAKQVMLPGLSSSLADEIAEATMRTVQMPISNCVDPLKDWLLINRVVLFCPQCKNVFINDPSAHSCGAGEETFLELHHAAAGPQSGLRCIFPDCSLSICTISGLRNHCILDHDFFITIDSITPSAIEQVDDPFLATRYDRSFMTMARHFSDFQNDDRSFLARMTDVDCFLPTLGKLERRHKPIGAMIPPPKRPPIPVRDVRPPPPPPKQLQSIAGIIKPYQIPRTSRWYHCQFCEKEYETHEGFVEHLTRNHVNVCTTCGKAYSTPNSRRSHMCKMTFNVVRQKPGMLVTGECAVCHERLNVEQLFYHVMKKHFPKVEFIHATGEMLPQAHDLKMESVSVQQQRIMNGGNERQDYRMKLVKMGGTPVHGVAIHQLTQRTSPCDSFSYNPPNKKNIDTRLMCYLCELTFDNSEELAEHLEEHPERWANCPFCSQGVKDHFEMQKHLLHEHSFKAAGQANPVCEFCRETLPDFPASHFIFRCRKMPCCTICGVRSSDPSANWSHLQRAHKLVLKRFQCGFCPSFFMSMSEYYDHQCSGIQPRIYSCSCLPDKFFGSINGFCDHFDSLHVDKNICVLCGFIAASPEVMARHRNTHLKADAMKTPTKQVYIVCNWLWPKQNSGYVRYKKGGSPPPSYMPIDRSRHYLVPMLSGPTVQRVQHAAPDGPRAMTLFDALEGNHRPQTAAVKPVQPVPPHRAEQFVPPRHPPHLTPAVRRLPPPKPIVPSSEVIMLSDDDDDIVVEAQLTKRRENGQAHRATVPSVNQFTTQVRVEQAAVGYNTTQHPGYVDDEVEEVALENRKSPAEEPIVKEIVDENGDDELAVVAQVEHSSGILPSSIAAGRQKNFKCTQCSLAFYTNGSLEVHMAGHRQDAGSLSTKETYGIPVTCGAWICRNCCIAFENEVTFVRHMAIHGDTVYTCAHCSGISFNASTLLNHMQAHDKKSVMYGCGICQWKFNSDLQLMDHLREKHGRSLFYFCKVCGAGHTDCDYVFEHVLDHKDTNWMMCQRIGACPANLLNFEPTDEADLRMKVLTKQIKLETPSDCTHRTLLLSNDTLVACKDCLCNQAWFNYLAHNQMLEEDKFPHFQQQPTPSGIQGLFPLLKHLTPVNEKVMASVAKQLIVHFKNNNRAPLPRPTAVATRRAVPTPRISAPAQPAVTAAGARVLLPAGRGPAVRVNPGLVRSMLPQQQILQQQQQQPVKRVVVTRPTVPYVVPEQNRCAECTNFVATDYDRQLHRMHNSKDTWFCRQCGTSKKTEMDLYLHYMDEHLKPAYLKFVSSGNFKASVFKLKCPIAPCSEEFAAIKAFERHVRNAHSNMLPFQSTNCDAKFATKELCEKHDQTHLEYLETNGIDAACCSLCGSLDMWSLPKEPITECLQSHVLRHGLQYRSACRACLKQFPADVTLTQVLDHITKEHGARVQDKYSCKICGLFGLVEGAFREHCKSDHVFNILVKSNKSERGELVVTAENEFTNYVGLKPNQTNASMQRPVYIGAKPGQQHRQQQIIRRLVAAPSTSAPSTSSTPSTSATSIRPRLGVSMSRGGNAALMTIADALSGVGASSASSSSASVIEVETLD